MQIDIYQVDAFTDKVFGGNPAAVCPLNAWLPDDLLQHVASENNLSETAFFIPSQQENPHEKRSNFDLRWFTTLATAFVLFQERGFIAETVTFSTKSGILTVTKNGDSLTMDLPAWQVEKEKEHKLLTKALGTKYNGLYKGKYWLAHYDSEEDIRSITPDFKALKEIDDIDFVIITAPSEKSEIDFVSRFFCPKFNIDEDPVTGSAHCILTPFWAEKLEKEEFNAYQASARGGHLKCALEKDRVNVTGKATLYLKGHIHV